MFLTLLTFISAIAISLIAAGYSILGLATLFAGAAVPIIAMGSALEVGKLVAASWLYHNWREGIPRALKAYLFTAIIVLVFITLSLLYIIVHCDYNSEAVISTEWKEVSMELQDL